MQAATQSGHDRLPSSHTLVNDDLNSWISAVLVSDDLDICISAAFVIDSVVSCVQQSRLTQLEDVRLMSGIGS